MINHHKYFIFGLLSIIAISYFNAIGGSFQFDDYRAIVENSIVQSWSLWTDDLSHGIRPLLKLSYLVNWKLSTNPDGFHIFNIVVHAINTVLLGVFIYSLLSNNNSSLKSEGNNRIIALYSALLFATHPIQTEAVTYITGRSMSLMSLFYLLSLISWLQGIKKQSILLIWIVSPILFCLAILVRETAITLPLLMLLIIILGFATRVPKKNTIQLILPHMVILIMGLLVLVFWHSGYQNMVLRNLEKFELFEQLGKDFSGYFYLLNKLVFPNNLSIDPQIDTSWNPVLVTKVAVIMLLIFVCWLYRKRFPWLVLAVFWFFIFLIPNLSVIPRNDVINERHAYLAGVGLFILFSKLLLFLPLKLHKYFMVVIIVFFTGQTINRNLDYNSELTLWQKEVKTYSKNVRAWNNLGYAYQLDKQFDNAKLAYEKSLSLEYSEITYNNLKQLSKGNLE